ncbi:hypothetical protein HanIR_Chr01g0042761 [Helianthus annuus]|nr:hypothetical protein HanIR_Chr01g0042761 [Helianthus annuus]
MESSKIEHAKRVEQLRKMELKRADYMKTEKAKKEVEKLESIMMVSSQAIESTSDEIVKLREEEPQLVELVKGYSPKINFVQDLNTDPKLASEDNYVDVITNVVRVVHRYSHNLEPGYD